MNQSTLRKIIYLDWDPIGVSEMSSFDLALDTEYDGYLAKLSYTISNGGNVEEIAQFLCWAEENMGMDVDESRNQMVAKLIWDCFDGTAN